MQLAFGITLAAGLAFLILTLFLGEIGDLVGGNTDVAHGGGLPWMSFTTVSLALVGWGLSGLIAVHLGLTSWLVFLAATAISVLFVVAVMLLIIKPLLRQQANSLVSQQSYVGSQATVILDISPDNAGQIQLTDPNGALVTLPAASTNAVSIPKGSTVIISEITSGRAVITTKENRE
jgi:membrane protein implicated in regulation of membrane protease activity